MYWTKSTEPNVIPFVLLDLTKYTKPNLLHQNYQTKSIEPNLPNQKYKTKCTKQNLPSKMFEMFMAIPTNLNQSNQYYQTKSRETKSWEN